MGILLNHGDYEVSDTLLVVAPLCTPPSQPQAWQLTYVSNVSLTSSTPQTDGPMVLIPVPNPHHLSAVEIPFFPIPFRTAVTLQLASKSILANYRDDGSRYAATPTFPQHGHLFGENMHGFRASTFGAAANDNHPSTFGSAAPDNPPATFGSAAPDNPLATFGSAAPGNQPSLFGSAATGFGSAAPENQTSLFGSAANNGPNYLGPNAGHVSGQSLFSNTATALGTEKRSLAPSREALEESAPWRHLNLPAHENSRILDHLRANYPKHGTAFIIVMGANPRTNPQLHPSKMRMEVCVQYRDATTHGAYFPTGREHGAGFPVTSFDATLLAVNAVIQPLSLCSSRQYSPHDNNVILRADDMFVYENLLFPPKAKWFATRSLLTALPRVTDPNTTYGGMTVQHERPRLLTLLHLKGKFYNRNVTARPISDIDVRITQRLYADVCAWMDQRKISPFIPKMLMPSSYAPAPPLKSFQDGRLDYVLALLARQLAYPGINDRSSDVRPAGTVEGYTNCGPVAYVNLDMNEVDLDEEAYRYKSTWSRHVVGGSVDTMGSTYVRISATEAPFESLEMRTVGGKVNEGRHMPYEMYP